jgi:hypothetical protein
MAALDNWITGNWGEDQFAEENAWYEFKDRVCVKCQWKKDCVLGEEDDADCADPFPCDTIQKAVDKQRLEDQEMDDSRYDDWLEEETGERRSAERERFWSRYYQQHPAECTFCKGARWWVEVYPPGVSDILGESDLKPCPVCSVKPDPVMTDFEKRRW